MTPTDTKTVFRRFAIPVPEFDHLKMMQRMYQKQNPDTTVSNNQALAWLLQDHKRLLAASQQNTNVDSEEQEHHDDQDRGYEGSILG